MKLLTVKIGQPRSSARTDGPEGLTGIDKRPVEGPVEVLDPGPKGVGGPVREARMLSFAPGPP